MNDEEKKLLQRELQILEKASRMLGHSYEVCREFECSKECSLSQLDQLEALTGRFACLNDRIIRKMLRLIDRLDMELEGTVRDSILRAEKKGLIDDANRFGEIRQIRNIIAHEYVLEDLSQLYRNVFASVPILLEVVEKIKKYCKRYSS